MLYEKDKYKEIELSHYELQIILAVLDSEVYLANEEKDEVGTDGVRRWYNKREVNDTRLFIINTCRRIEESEKGDE